MDSDEGKLFIGGIAWDTTEDTLRNHFSQYGDVAQVVIMRDKTTGRPRGFGFIVFSDPAVLDRVLQDKHTIDGRTVEAKRALSREEQQTSSRSGSFNGGGGGRNSSGGGNFKTKKIFVGGLPSTLTEEGFRQYFETYGQVTDVVIMFDQHTQRPRGFGFITFDAEDSVDRVLHKVFHEMNGKLVEVKRALPKDANPGGGVGGGGGRGGGYQGYGVSGGNSSDGRMDGNRYMQNQTSAGGYAPYSGYGAAGYGYGAANSGVSYGGYGSFGVGGYGGGPAGAYGMPGALKNNWAGQVPSNYAAASYGANAGYGGNSASVAMGQSQGGASGYGAYGYGNYGGSDGSYPGGYGAQGGRAGNSGNNSASSGGDGYGDANGNSGYGNEGWRSDPSQVSGGYVGGYSRQAAQQ